MRASSARWGVAPSTILHRARSTSSRMKLLLSPALASRCRVTMSRSWGKMLMWLSYFNHYAKHPFTIIHKIKWNRWKFREWTCFFYPDFQYERIWVHLLEKTSSTLKRIYSVLTGSMPFFSEVNRSPRQDMARRETWDRRFFTWKQQTHYDNHCTCTKDTLQNIICETC